MSPLSIAPLTLPLATAQAGGASHPDAVASGYIRPPVEIANGDASAASAAATSAAVVSALAAPRPSDAPPADASGEPLSGGAAAVRSSLA